MFRPLGLVRLQGVTPDPELIRKGGRVASVVRRAVGFIRMDSCPTHAVLSGVELAADKKSHKISITLSSGWAREHNHDGPQHRDLPGRTGDRGAANAGP